MRVSTELNTSRILEAFTEEVTARRGEVSDVFDDGRRLFARSVLPQVEELRRSDAVKGGVALRADDQEVWLHPYVFRLVCRNGMILAQTLTTKHLDDLHLSSPEVATEFLREAVESCCAPEVFAQSVHQIRGVSQQKADSALNLMVLLSQMSRGMNAHFSNIIDRLFRDGDHSRFGLMNAITSLARDTEDPEARWNLEELGGGIVIGNPEPSPDHPLSAMIHEQAVDHEDEMSTV